MSGQSSQAGSEQLSILVPLGARSYSIEIVSGGGGELASFVRSALAGSLAGRACKHSLVIHDPHLDRLVPVVRGGLESLGIAVSELVVPAGEGTKCLARASEAYDRLAALPADRSTLVVALGGGVIGDLAGFVAATFMRGLPLFMVPTSLLAQVDSSVGGKVGVNLAAGKNLVGAFHQPIGVWIDTEFLGTLPEREYRAGLAEVVKYGMILDEAFFNELEASIPEILGHEPRVIRRMVARSCELKAGVVSRDEREETGLRAVLNFGHTIGHALEALAGYSGFLLHGEAVAIGMVAECRLAERLGWIGPEVTGRLVRLLSAFGLPTEPASRDAAATLVAMGRDKKNRAGKIRFVLPRMVGGVELTDVPTEADLHAVLR